MCSVAAEHLSDPPDAAILAGAGTDGAATGAATTTRKQKPKDAYPIPEGGLTEWPKDWSVSKHKPLAKKDFADEAVYYDGKADLYDKMAKRSRQEAHTCRQLGGLKDRTTAKKLIKMQQQFNELRAQMIAENVDVDAILKSAAPAVENATS